jgi:hypothetical protein
MTERDTSSLLRAALQRRAEYGMQTTNTDRELQRLLGQMAPVAKRRRLRAALATAAGIAVIGGGVGLGLALTSGEQTSELPPAARPTQTTLPAGTLPAGFPLGTFRHSGTNGLTTLRLTRDAQAVVSDAYGIAVNHLIFTTPNIVTFDTKGGAGCTTIGRYRWAVSNDELVLTAVDDSCPDRRISVSEAPWGPVRRTSSS